MTTALLFLNLAAFAWTLSRGLSITSPDAKSLYEVGGQLGIAIYTGEYWRLFTAAFLHAGILHLLFNMYALWQIGPVAERVYRRAFPGLYIAAIFGGSCLSAYANPRTVSVGASGAVFGTFGLILAAVALKAAELSRHEISHFTRSALPFLIINFIPRSGVDMWCHIGGFAVGALLGLIVVRLRPPESLRVAIGFLAAAGIASVFIAVPPRAEGQEAVGAIRFQKHLSACLEFVAAEQLTPRGIPKEVKNPDCVRVRAESLRIPELYADAIADCRKKSAEACDLVVQIYQSFGAWDDAIELLAPLCDQDPGACGHIAGIQLRAGRTHAALEYAEKGCAVNDAVSCYNLACAQCLEGKPDAAFATLERSVSAFRRAGGKLPLADVRADTDLTCIRERPGLAEMVGP